MIWLMYNAHLWLGNCRCDFATEVKIDWQKDFDDILSIVQVFKGQDNFNQYCYTVDVYDISYPY